MADIPKRSRNFCIDEPFHPGLWQGRRQNNKATWDELGRVWEDTVRKIAPPPQPILPPEEIDFSSHISQKAYLRSLMTESNRVVIDEVRIWNRMPEILPDDMETTVVHLVRDPLNWVTAQLLPQQGKAWYRSRRDAYEQFTFFHKRSDYNSWRYEEIIKAAIAKDHAIFRALPLSAGKLARLPAFMKLLAFWWAANLELHHRLARWTGGRVVTISLAEFSMNPADVMRRVHDAAGSAFSPHNGRIMVMSDQSGRRGNRLHAIGRLPSRFLVCRKRCFSDNRFTAKTSSEFSRRRRPGN